MKKTHFVLALFIAVIVSSCKNEETDPNFAGQITGTYFMKTYKTHSGTSSPGPNDKIVISRKDDKHAQVVIDYADPGANDVTADNVSISKNGETYNLSQGFSNATLSGTVTGNSLTLNMDYTNGNFAEITANK